MRDCASWWLWGLVAPGLATGSNHSGHPASTFPLTSNIIYIPFLIKKKPAHPGKGSIPNTFMKLGDDFPSVHEFKTFWCN